ncbi:phage tail protein [Paenibacillus xylaniclasticus]|uniref:phage tail protein n=1 Tax=Paenibacillus xylaniclasticus TaxID=588083 RepID=UPI000FDB4083|nr:MULTISPECIES: tail fiber protein [Paenibacillus]GFN33783.1 tail Collar domain-containing protein [Paenibacillus curdlanolyticus]
MADAYIGEIRMFAGDYAPKDWAFCEGQLVSIQQNQALFSILGTMYGGDGKTNFALPDLRGRVPIQYGQGPGLSPRTQGVPGGSAAVTLLENQMPAHNHVPQGGGAADKTDPAGAVWGATGRSGTQLYDGTINVDMNPMALQQAGNSQQHNNMQPYLSCSFIICIRGYFPPRS